MSGKPGAKPSPDRVEVASEESFPASDAPGWQPLRVGLTPRHYDALRRRATAETLRRTGDHAEREGEPRPAPEG